VRWILHQLTVRPPNDSRRCHLAPHSLSSAWRSSQAPRLTTGPLVVKSTSTFPICPGDPNKWPEAQHGGPEEGKEFPDRALRLRASSIPVYRCGCPTVLDGNGRTRFGFRCTWGLERRSKGRVPQQLGPLGLTLELLRFLGLPRCAPCLPRFRELPIVYDLTAHDVPFVGTKTTRLSGCRTCGDRSHRDARFGRALSVLLFEDSKRGRVRVVSVSQRRLWYLAIGSLRTMLVEHVEPDEFSARSRFLAHGSISFLRLSLAGSTSTALRLPSSSGKSSFGPAPRFATACPPASNRGCL